MPKKVLTFTAVAAAVAIVIAGTALTNPTPPRITFPGGKQFAFSIVDDTDLATLERLQPIYAVLSKYGIRSTKTVWTLDSNNTSHDANNGDTLTNPDYRAFIKSLKNHGFEIALHGVRGGGSPRADIVRGLGEFRQELGSDPTMQVNHSLNEDNLYWGSKRYSLGLYRLSFGRLMTGVSSGEDPLSPYFWGDLAKERIRYVRQFTFSEVNLLRVNPSMPYRRAETPYVNFWFQTSNGANVDAFDELLAHERLDQLEQEGGVCLVYSHLGAGSFNKPGGLDRRFEERIKDVASRNGWFAPASEILDYLAKRPGWTGQPGFLERFRMETQFTVGRAMNGGS